MTLYRGTTGLPVPSPLLSLSRGPGLGSLLALERETGLLGVDRGVDLGVDTESSMRLSAPTLAASPNEGLPAPVLT